MPDAPPATLRFSTDKRELERAIAPWRREPYRWENVAPSLEDVFIQLMADQPDDRYAL